MNMAGLQRWAARQVRASGLLTSVEVRWTDRSLATLDAATQRWTGTVTVRRDTVSILVHIVAARTGIIQFKEVEDGDAICDFPLSYTLTGKEDVVVSIGGIEFVPADLGKKLAASYDALSGGSAQWRTVLLRRRN